MARESQRSSFFSFFWFPGMLSSWRGRCCKAALLTDWALFPALNFVFFTTYVFTTLSNLTFSLRFQNLRKLFLQSCNIFYFAAWGSFKQFFLFNFSNLAKVSHLGSCCSSLRNSRGWKCFYLIYLSPMGTSQDRSCLDFIKCNIW